MFSCHEKTIHSLENTLIHCLRRKHIYTIYNNIVLYHNNIKQGIKRLKSFFCHDKFLKKYYVHFAGGTFPEETKTQQIIIFFIVRAFIFN